MTIEQYDPGHKAENPAHLTYLLMSWQVHAETREMCIHAAIRLDTIQAVQQESQWRVRIDPRSQTLNLHWIRIHRGQNHFDQAQSDKLRILQREEGLEGFVLDGQNTVLLLLEDVRLGDVIETCYTIQTRPLLLSDHYGILFSLPGSFGVAKYLFSFRFLKSRPIKWKSHGSELKLSESEEGDELIWRWAGTGYNGKKSEPSTPEWFMDYPWVQVTDCPDWKTVAVAFAEAWREELEDPVLNQITEEIIGAEKTLLGRIERAIRLVQDEHRYLSLDLELGAHVPTTATTVARRRFGDCKDLAFLLVHLLKRLGVPARPVLVHTRLRKTVEQLLPMPELFNHVVVEFQVDGVSRWIDATLRFQGGGPLGRVCPEFGVGLPIDRSSTSLIPAPRASAFSGSLELKETILLDTQEDQSLLAMVFTGTGTFADGFRADIAGRGIEEFAKENLQRCAQRYANIQRDGKFQFRDDRDENEFVGVDVFRITGCLQPHSQAGYCRFVIPNTLIRGFLAMPEEGPRRAPFGLPWPIQITHTIEIESPALAPGAFGREKIGNTWLQFIRSHKSSAGFWSVTMTLATLGDSVPPERLPGHRRTVEEILRSSMWEINLPIGHPRPRRRSHFGALPYRGRRLTQPATQSTPAAAANPSQHSATSSAMATPPQAVRKALTRKQAAGIRRRKKKLEAVFWILILAIIISGLVYVFILATQKPRPRPEKPQAALLAKPSANEITET